MIKFLTSVVVFIGYHLPQIITYYFGEFLIEKYFGEIK